MSMTENEFNFRKELIYKSIEDTSSTIKALDTKVSFVFIVIGLIFGYLANVKDTIQQVYTICKSIPIISGLFAMSLLAYIILTSFCLYYGFITLKPKNNPIDHVQNDGLVSKNVWYLENDKNNNIKINLIDYIDTIKSLTQDDLIITLSTELMKLSFSRNEKLKNSNQCIKMFMVSLIPFLIVIIYMFIYYFIYK